MDAAVKQVEKTILAAIPAYEMYLLQTMGKPFLLKPPLFRSSSEKLRVTFDSVEQPNGAHQSPERLVMHIEYNHAMGACTVKTEYWQDPKATEPTARGEPKLDATSENLMAPAFAFGWLHKLVSAEGIKESTEGEDMPLVRIERAEALILKADEVLREAGYEIEADSYESYASTLDKFLLTGALREDEQVEGVLKKVGDIVRKAAGAFGAAKGGAAGLKARWGDFKASVSKSYGDSHKKAFDKFSGRGGDEKGKKGSKAKSDAPAAKSEPAATSKKGGKKPALKLVKGGKGKGKDRFPGGKMKDTEYSARYGKKRMASSLDEPEHDITEMTSDLRDSFYEDEFNALDVEGLEALEEMLQLDEGGERFKVLTKKLTNKGVEDPKALAAYIGREKYGNAGFQKKAAAGRGRRHEAAVSIYQRLSGVAQPMNTWSLNRDK